MDELSQANWRSKSTNGPGGSVDFAGISHSKLPLSVLRTKNARLLAAAIQINTLNKYTQASAYTKYKKKTELTSSNCRFLIVKSVSSGRKRSHALCDRVSWYKMNLSLVQRSNSYPSITYYWTIPLILDPLISCWETDKFKNCWYKSVRILEVLKLLFQQFLNLSSSQRDVSDPILGALSNNRWSGGIPFSHQEKNGDSIMFIHSWSIQWKPQFLTFVKGHFC
jgi:hypothetical protein